MLAARFREAKSKGRLLEGRLSMPLIAGKQGPSKVASSSPANASAALEWLWKYLRDIPHPQVLDCGPISQSTVDTLLRRGAKIHVTDLVTLALRPDANLWDRTGKVPVFRTAEFLNHLPVLSEGSLSLILGWHLLDLLPREALPDLLNTWLSCLQSGGVLFCLLREPYLPVGAEMMAWFDSLTGLAAGGEGRMPFPYPALTNREMERLVSSGSLKTFLTRQKRREVLVVK